MSLAGEDGIELGEFMEFLAGWLRSEGSCLAPLERFVGSGAYGVEQLLSDVTRFAFLLGGDGAALLAGDDL